jgi:Tfp pilus assembly protein PilF
LKWSRNRLWFLAAAFLAAALAAYAVLPRWLANVPATARMDGVFFRTVEMAGGPVRVRRSPAEIRASLTKLIAETPSDAGLYPLRAHEAEEVLDFAAAEADWKKCSELAADKGAGQLALADFYHRRLRPEDELRALDAAAAAGPASRQEKYLPADQQRPWHTFERALELVDAQALPAEAGMARYRAWIARYPRERAVYNKFFDYLLARKQFAAATEFIASCEKTFPEDAAFPVSARARIEESRGSIEQALAVYDRAFQPLWPPELVKDYFGLLERTHNLRKFLEHARAAVVANPNDLGAAVRIFYYYQQQGNLPAAQRALIEFRLRKAAWNPEELWVLARLFEDTRQYQEAVRNYYAMYVAAGQGPAAERALAGIIGVLFAAPEQPIRFGAGDLSFYRDVATMDPYPGFLNGILSLILNSTYPSDQYAEEDRASAAYFHRARAAELVALFDSRFPKSTRRAELRSRLIQTYATYGDSDGVIRAGRQFLADFPKANERTDVAMLVAEAFARKQDSAQEFAMYDALLKELAARAEGVPLGADSKMARSGDYSRVLERYISRLVSMKRPLDALRLLRSELDRNPDDPGLYERLAAFLEQNRLDSQIEQVYRRAIAQFGSPSWYDKLARWYVRRRRAAEFRELTREIVGVFNGADLERYFRQVVPGAALGAATYLQVNLYAHEKFPQNLTFVHNLLAAYSSRETLNRAEWEKLLRSYWYYDEALRVRFFQFLSGNGRLDAEVESARVGAALNLAALRLVAEAETWRSHFEDAAAPLDQLAAVRPGDTELARRAASLDRSLAAYDPAFTAKAAGIEEKLAEFAPRDHAALTTLGEIYADRELFDKSRPYWNRLAAIEPGKSDGYLEAATIFWDYFLYDDALRLIEDGRKQLGYPALFAYEAGAIYENKRDYTRAVVEYAKGAEPGSAARARLLRLAKRPAQRDAIEKLTVAQTAGANPAQAAVSLRTEVLETQERRNDLVEFLLGVVGRSSSLELLDSIRETAGNLGLDQVQGSAIERQIAVATDPVERMRLRLDLMRFYEGRREPERARQIVETLYAQNPEILGVVRATANFYWRNKLPKQAVDVLVAASAAANSTLKKQFTLEAATKSTESADYTRARKLLEQLLQSEPSNPEYVAAMADTYARQGDDAGLREFYAAKIREITDQSLRASLRRGLVPVLARQKDYAGAVDQYIEIIKVFPEDDGVTREAASFAGAHGEKARLLGYFQKAVADSPRDFRWPMVLARLDTFFEDIPAAIAAYSQAVAIRPDRVDLYIARASLEERLMRFDAALATYTKLYGLTYQDPHWMRKVAEVHARQGRKDEAVKALRKALIEGRPERPQPFFEAARILDSWNMLDAAREMAERGVSLAGNDLLTDGDYISGARIYARIMTRLRTYKEALGRLEKLPADLNRFNYAVAGIGEAVKTYFTPEEKSAFAAFLGERNPRTAAALAGTAGLADVEARWLFGQLMANPKPGMPELQRLQQLQSQRMRHDELAGQLLDYWNVYPPVPGRDALLLGAAAAYRAAGDEAGELQALTMAQERMSLAGDEFGRYLQLLLKRDPHRVVTLAGPAPYTDRDAAANAAVASGDPALALEAVAARGDGLSPVWTRAHTALTGLYYADSAPSAEPDFLATLGPNTIGEVLGKPVDQGQQLAGDIWFYYGTAYGEYLAAKKSGDPEDYLPAILEGAPARSSAYFTLAEYYREAGEPARAIADYQHTLELDPKRGDVEDRIAEVLWSQGKRDQAVAHWKAAFQAFYAAGNSRLTEAFWSGVETALRDVGRRKLLPEVREDADRVLRTYIRRNGEYRVQPLLRAAFEASADPAAGVAWIADLIHAAPQPLPVYTSIVEASWIPVPLREPIYRRILEAAEAAAARLDSERMYRQSELQTWRLRWINYLIDTRQVERARAELDAMPEETRRLSSAAEAIEIRIAAQRGTLAALLDRYQRDPDRAPSADALTETATALKKDGDSADARRLLEFLYTRELDRRNFTAANFLGLAEIRLEENDTEAAVTLLRRMTLVADQPFEDLEAAADLLQKAGKQAEARRFLEERVKAVPWDPGARVKLGDASVAASPEAPYELRARAAELKPEAKTGSGELDLLASGAAPPASAEKPYFYFARLKAAAAADPATRLRLLAGALAVAPDANQARIEFVRAALVAQRYQLVVSAMEPLWQESGLRYTLPEIARANYSLTYYAGEFLSNQGFTTSERAALAEGLAHAYVAVGQTNLALGCFRLALAIEPTAEARAGLERLQAHEKRQTEEAERRPVISDGFQQEFLVRPRRKGGNAK